MKIFEAFKKAVSFKHLFAYFPKKLKISNLFPYIPNFKHFIVNGDKCSTECGVTCFYCDKKADEMNEFLNSIGVKI